MTFDSERFDLKTLTCFPHNQNIQNILTGVSSLDLSSLVTTDVFNLKVIFLSFFFFIQLRIPKDISCPIIYYHVLLLK